MNSPPRLLLLALLVALLSVTIFLMLRGDGTADRMPNPGGGAPVATEELAGTGTGDPGTDDQTRKGAADAAASRTAVATVAAPEGPTYRLEGTALQENGVAFINAKVIAYAGSAHDRGLSMTGLFSHIEASVDDPRSSSGLKTQLGEPIAEAAIRADGQFVLEELPSRHVRLIVDHHYYALTQAKVVHIDPERQVFVTLETRLGGHLVGRVIGLPPVRAGTVRLTAEVDIMSIMRRPEDFMGKMLNSFSTTVEVGLDGRFEFRAAAPSNNIQLFFSSVGSSNSGTGKDGTGSDGTRSDGRAARFGPTSLRAGQTREVVLHTVRCGALLATVTTPDHQPIPQARVRVQPEDVSGRRSQAFSIQSATTDADGHGTVANLRPGFYSVGVSATGFVGTDRQVKVRGGETVTLAVTLATGGSVAGVVVDEAGNPVEDAGIAYLRSMNVPVIGDITELTGADLLARSARGSRIRSAADGRFVLGGIIDEGEFSVIAWHKQLGGGRAKDISVGDQKVQIQLQHPARVVGHVVDDETGEPIGDFAVRTLVRMAMVMERPTRSARIESSVDGAFVLERVRAGKAKLSVQAPGYADYGKTIEVAPGGELDVGELRLEKACEVRGIVVDPDGRPVTGANIARKARGLLDNPILRSMSGGASCTSDANGRFELAGLPPGAIRLKATAIGHASAISQRVRLRPGQIVEDIKLTLGSGGSVHGELLLPAGVAMTGWMITLGNQKGGSMQSAYVAADGTFRFDHVDPGRYDIQGMNEATMTELSSGKMSMFRPGRQLDIGKLIRLAQEQIVRTKCRVKTNEITEVILDGSDQGADGVAVVFRVSIGDQPLTTGLMEIERLDTGDLTQAFIENGRAKMDSLQPGSIRVQVRTGITMTPVGGPLTLEIPAAKTYAAIVDLPGGSIRGVVVDQTTGEPMEHAIVRIVAARGSVNDQVDEIGFATTNDAGEFQFEGLLDGRYSLFANESFFQRGGRLKSGRLEGISIESGRAQRSVILRTRRAARATLMVDDARGRPQRHAMVFAVDETGKPLSTLPSRTNDQGRATVMGLPTGEIRLVVLARGLVPGFSDVKELEPGRETEFRMTLDTGARVRVRVESARGLPLEGARLSARWNGGPWIPLALVQRFDPRTKQVDLGHLAAGRVEFRVHHAGRAPFAVIREIPAGPSVELVFTAPQ